MCPRVVNQDLDRRGPARRPGRRPQPVSRLLTWRRRDSSRPDDLRGPVERVGDPLGHHDPTCGNGGFKSFRPDQIRRAATVERAVGTRRRRTCPAPATFVMTDAADGRASCPDRCAPAQSVAEPLRSRRGPFLAVLPLRLGRRITGHESWGVQQVVADQARPEARRERLAIGPPGTIWTA